MSDVTWRPAERADAAAIAAVFNAVAAQFDSRDTWSVGRMEENFDHPTWNAQTDSRVAFRAGEMVAAGAVSPPPPGGERLWAAGAVRPEHRGTGLGREMLRWQLGRVAEMRAEQGADDPWVVLVGTHADDAAAERLLRRFGLSPERHFFVMERPVGGAMPELKLPAELRVVPFSPDREQELYVTHQEAFSDHWGYQAREFDDWVRMIRSVDARPELSRLAVTDGREVAGFVLSLADVDPTRMWLQSIGTRRAWRGRGVASGLISATLRGFADAGVETAVLDVDSVNPTGALGVYERMGFEAMERSVAYSCAIH